MLELKNNTLSFHFPEIHPEARVSVVFNRTLRIPDDGRTHPLPPGLGHFPIKHVDDYKDKVPSKWVQHGGVMLLQMRGDEARAPRTPALPPGRAVPPHHSGDPRLELQADIGAQRLLDVI